MDPTPYQRRMDLAARTATRFSAGLKGVLLVGSTAYNPQLVKDSSDLDLILIAEDSDIETLIQSEFSTTPELAARLRYRYFDGYRFDENREGIPLSFHILRSSVFESICSPQIRNLRLFIDVPHKPAYQLFSFDGSSRTYTITPTSKEDGLRVLNVPVFFIEGERCCVGIHADKLLSNPVILHERESFVHDNLVHLWAGAARHLHDQALRIDHTHIDLRRMSILNALYRKERFSEETRRNLDQKTKVALRSLTDVLLVD